MAKNAKRQARWKRLGSSRPVPKLVRLNQCPIARVRWMDAAGMAGWATPVDTEHVMTSVAYIVGVGHRQLLLAGTISEQDGSTGDLMWIPYGMIESVETADSPGKPLSGVFDRARFLKMYEKYIKE